MTSFSYSKFDRRLPAIKDQELRLLRQKVLLLEQEIKLLRRELEASEADRKTLEKRSYLDHLTGALNQAGLQTQLANLEPGIKSGRIESASFLYLDLDNFHHLQSERSHAWGDEALKVFAAVIENSVRVSDFVVRLGGDEFGALLIGASYEKARVIAQRISETLNNFSVIADGFSGHIMTTYGIGTYPSVPFSEIIKVADDEMLRKKSAKGIKR